MNVPRRVFSDNECIFLYISFVDQIESIYSECAAVMVVAAVMLITLTGIEVSDIYMYY